MLCWRPSYRTLSMNQTKRSLRLERYTNCRKTNELRRSLASRWLHQHLLSGATDMSPLQQQAPTNRNQPVTHISATSIPSNPDTEHVRSLSLCRVERSSDSNADLAPANEQKNNSDKQAQTKAHKTMTALCRDRKSSYSTGCGVEVSRSPGKWVGRCFRQAVIIFHGGVNHAPRVAIQIFVSNQFRLENGKTNPSIAEYFVIEMKLNFSILSNSFDLESLYERTNWKSSAGQMLSFPHIV